MSDLSFMKSVEESVTAALDGSDADLFPFLPYILQDLWEIGSDPETVTAMIRKHVSDCSAAAVLDLGCGKGAVSVIAASTSGCRCHGIDAVPEFIAEARKKAAEYQVDHLCIFETGDIRKKVRELEPYDVIILGSIGPVFGDFQATLTALETCLSSSGIIIIDEGYIEDHSDFTHPSIFKKQEILQQIHAAGMQLIDEEIIDRDAIQDSDEWIFDRIQKRCSELADAYPDKKELFENYIKKQAEENEVLENRIVCSAMVVKRRCDNWLEMNIIS